MRTLLLALCIAFLPTTFAEASIRAENLEKCRLFDKLPPSGQRKIARTIRSTPAAIKAACRTIRNESRRPARPSRPARPARPAPHKEPAPTCNCGPGEVCVRRYFTYECEFYSSSGNRCSIQSDCFGSSRCENGACTR